MIFKQNIFAIILTILVSVCSCEERSLIDESTVFRYNEHKNINSLDPIFAKDIANIQAVNQLFNGLVEMDNQLNVVPSVAKSWEISENGKIYTFKIDTTVKFHPHPKLKKRNVTAYDFEYSFNRLVNKNIASPGAWVLNNVKNFKAINDSIFQIELFTEFNSFLEILTMKYCSVVPKEIVDSLGSSFSKKPILTDKFILNSLLLI